MHIQQMSLIFPPEAHIILCIRKLNTYTKGDWVVRPPYGLCEVAGQTVHDGRAFLMLIPSLEDARVYVPQAAADCLLRPALTKKEAADLISRIPSFSLCREKGRSRTGELQAMLAGGKAEDLARIVMEVYRKNAVSIEKGRGISNYTEGRLFRCAEDMLNAELAHALGLDPQQVQPYIKQKVQS